MGGTSMELAFPTSSLFLTGYHGGWIDIHILLVNKEVQNIVMYICIFLFAHQILPAVPTFES
jgi:hypothetical protein